MTLQPRPGLMDIKPYVPGAAAPAGAVKLSSNENALGCSPKAAEAFRAAADKLHVYPDGGATRLRQAIAEAEDVDADRIVCGAGSDELLQLIGRAYLAPDDVVVQSQYGFLVYRLVAMQSGARCVSAPERNYTTDVDAMIEAARDGARIVFLANPNNPTGTWISGAEVRRLREGLADDVLLVLDGAYAEYVDAPGWENPLKLADDYGNVAVTRTFSKIHGLAGLRLGWMYGPKAVVDVIHRVRGPFNVNLPAIEAGVAAIGDREFVARSKAHNDQWLAYLAQQLGGLGFEVTPSVCNFVLVHFPDEPGRSAADADRFLTEHGLVVRALAPYGLPHALRITVGTEADNRAVVAALAAFAGRSR
ncbi:histidinol-phosphate transaminase [Alkalicaulis satelles]|uniref:Histidinol-phosphate aminotransferase n=1 Tax=Alkalicaulis satelles TaxID=2609175 RepID=A0A5M6ZI60_9PROT|nr:histidinol-phosphate transaminase [Alkalicaulis satelles]KAA5803387.1 histidinol-phosphate transaminase [Alkalicaulis satelles]